MPQSKPVPLVRLNIRLPEPVYEALRAESEVTAVAMSALVRQLVIRWAQQQRREDHPFPAVPVATSK